jgi:hypothetical protein
LRDQNSQNNPEKVKKVGELTFPGFRPYQKGTGIRMVRSGMG